MAETELPGFRAWHHRAAMEIPEEEIIAIPVTMYVHRDDIPVLAAMDGSQDHGVTMMAGGRTLWSLITGCREHLRREDNYIADNELPGMWERADFEGGKHG